MTKIYIPYSVFKDIYEFEMLRHNYFVYNNTGNKVACTIINNYSVRYVDSDSLMKSWLELWKLIYEDQAVYQRDDFNHQIIVYIISNDLYLLENNKM